MFEVTVDRFALALSYLYELLLLPLHAGRLTALRLSSQHASYELTLGLERELVALRQTIRVAGQMERELAEMDLALDSSRRLAVKALQAATARLTQRVATSFPMDTAETQAEGIQEEDREEVRGRGGRVVGSEPGDRAHPGDRFAGGVRH